MKLFSRCYFIKNVSNVWLSNVIQNPNGAIGQHRLLFANGRQAFRYPFERPTQACSYSSDNKKTFVTFGKKTDAIKEVLEHKKEQLKVTEQRIRLRGVEIVSNIKHQKEVTGEKFRARKEDLMKDILETKAKVKERFEDVVEKENVFTIPNVLCMTRIAMSPYLGYSIIESDYKLALGMMVFAGVTDLLDGWIARNWKGQSTKMGSFLDPLADKVLIATLFISLTYQNLIPLSLTLLIVSRDVLLVIAAFVIRYMSLPPPRTLSRYFDVTNATAQLAPTFISKVNTAIQLVFVGTTLASPVFHYVDHPAMQALCAATAISTVASAVSYLVSKDTYKFLKKKS